MARAKKTGDTYGAQLETLDDRISVTRGKAATEAQVAALEKKLGFRLPKEYAAFLREVGAVGFESETGDVRFLGVAPRNKALAIEPAIDALETEYQRWDKDPVQAAPVLTFGELGSECYVVAKGGLHHFRRGVIERADETFEVQRLARARMHDRRQRRRRTLRRRRPARRGLSRTILRGASFRNANCTSTDFEDCDLGECDFTGATR